MRKEGTWESSRLLMRKWSHRTTAFLKPIARTITLTAFEAFESCPAGRAPESRLTTALRADELTS